MSTLFESNHPTEPLIKTSPLTSYYLLVVLGAIRLVDTYFLRQIDETEDAAACYFIKRLFDHLTLCCPLRINPLYYYRSLAIPIIVRYTRIISIPGLFIIEIQAYYSPPTSCCRNELVYNAFVDSYLTRS